MSVAIITDSNSGIFEKEAQQNGLYVVPMPILIDGKTYYEGIDIEINKFFELQDAGTPMSTSQPSLADVLELWENVLKEYDEIVYIPMSSGLSGSCKTAMAFAQEFDGKVVVVDNHRVSVTMRRSVYNALDLAKKGYNANQIKDALEKDAYNASIYIALSTLEHLKKGGRITPTAAMIGDLLHVKPVLTIQGDVLDAYTKTRGIKKAKKAMKEAIVKDITERFGGDTSNLMIATSGSLTDEETIQEWNEEVKALYPDVEFFYDPLPLSILCHIGRDAVAIAIMSKDCE